MDKSEKSHTDSICQAVPCDVKYIPLKNRIKTNCLDTLDVEIHLVGSSEPLSAIHKRVAKIDVSEFFFSPTPRAGKTITPIAINAVATVVDSNAPAVNTPEILDQLLLELGLQEFGQYFSSSFDEA